MKKKIEEWKFSSGALVLCLVAFPDGPDVSTFQWVDTCFWIGHCSPCFSVETSPDVGNTFTQSRSDWRDGTYEIFKDWALKKLTNKEDSDDEGDVPVRFQKAKDISFRRKKNGVFILDPIRDFKTVKDRQRVIRGYIGAVYSMFINILWRYLLFWQKYRRFHPELNSLIPLPSRCERRPNHLFSWMCPWWFCAEWPRPH